MKHRITKYNVNIEIGLGSFSSPPSARAIYLGDLNYWFRYNLSNWKKLNINVINFMDHIKKFESKEELLKYLNK